MIGSIIVPIIAQTMARGRGRLFAHVYTLAATSAGGARAIACTCVRWQTD